MAQLNRWLRRRDCNAQVALADELHRFGPSGRFRVLRHGEQVLFDDRFWPSVGVSPITALPCGLDDPQGLLLWGFGQPSLLLRPDFIATRKRFPEDVNFWQYPCVTEGDAFAVHQTLSGPQLKDGALQLYLGLPWATWIDRNSWSSSTLQSIAERLAQLRAALQTFSLELEVHSVCQHVLWRKVLHMIRAAGVTTLWLSHQPLAADVLDGVLLRPWHLYPVNAREADRCDSLVIKPIAHRRWLASFIGAYLDNYISDVRLGLRSFAHIPDFCVELRDEWHFTPVVYGQQVEDPVVIARVGDRHCDDDLHRYNRVLSDSRFVLCPSGAGPNSLRLWEALSVGSIPVILSDQLVLPDLRELGDGCFRRWDEIVLFHSEADLQSLPMRLQKMSLQELQWRSDQAIALMQLVNNNSCFGGVVQRPLPALRRQDS